MHRSCASDFADFVAGFSRFLGIDDLERKRSRKLRAAKDEQRSERRETLQVVENLRIFRSELREREASHGDAQQQQQQQQHDIQSQARSPLREEREARAADVQSCKNVCLRARRDLAESESQLKDALASGMQPDREEGAATTRADLAKASHSILCDASAVLQDQISVCPRVEGVFQARTGQRENTPFTHLRGVDVTQQESVQLNLVDRASTFNAKFTTVYANDGSFESACDTFVFCEDAVEFETGLSQHTLATRTNDLHIRWTASSSSSTHAESLRAILNMYGAPKFD